MVALSRQVLGLLLRPNQHDPARRGQISKLDISPGELVQLRARGLGGWVRNLADGRVEALFEGDKAVVENMLAWCRKGPPHSYVDHVDIDWQPYQGDLADFRVVH